MKLRELSKKQISQQLGAEGIRLKIGPFKVEIRSHFKLVADAITSLYAEFEISESEFADFHVRILTPGLLRKVFRPQCRFFLDHHEPFKPLPANQSFAMFEWGLNWAIAASSNQYLILHAAVVEKNGSAIILPGMPGAGKSTLCASLVLDGWRLLSDEMTLFDREKNTVTPVPRPIALKNQSIQIIRSRYPEAVFGPEIHETSKGTISHIRPSSLSTEQMFQTATPRHILFPKYEAGASSQLTRASSAKTFYELAENSFNFHVLGQRGFNGMKALVDQCSCHHLRYSFLDEAHEIIDKITIN